MATSRKKQVHGEDVWEVDHRRNHYKNDYLVIQDCGNSIRVLLEHYAKLNTPGVVTDGYFDITPKKVLACIKTKKWQDFINSVNLGRSSD